MKIEAIYDNGRIELPPSLRLASKRFSVRIEIPESEIIADPESKDAGQKPNYVLPPEVHALAKEMSDRLDRIRNAPPSDEDLPNLTQKQYERMKAFEFREKLRAERDE
jgi:hypothetical protein